MSKLIAVISLNKTLVTCTCKLTFCCSSIIFCFFSGFMLMMQLILVVYELFIFHVFSLPYLHCMVLFSHTIQIQCSPPYTLSTPSCHPELIRPECQAVFTECPFVDYSLRNHVAQLNYQGLQRLLRHLRNPLFNHPIAAKISMSLVNKEAFFSCPCLEALPHKAVIWSR